MSQIINTNTIEFSIKYNNFNKNQLSSLSTTSEIVFNHSLTPIIDALTFCSNHIKTNLFITIINNKNIVVYVNKQKGYIHIYIGNCFALLSSYYILQRENDLQLPVLLDSPEFNSLFNEQFINISKQNLNNYSFDKKHFNLSVEKLRNHLMSSKTLKNCNRKQIDIVLYSII